MSVGYSYIQIITGSFNTKKSCVSWKMFETEFKFSKLFKTIVFRGLRVNQTLCVADKVIRQLAKKMGEKMKKKRMNFFPRLHPTNDLSLLESSQLHIIAKYKASKCCKIEVIIRSGYVKKVLLKILQNSHESSVPESLF